MKSLGLVLFPLVGLALVAFARPTGADEGKAAAPAAKSEAVMPFFGNQTCPVSGEAAKHDKYAEKDGQRIYTCCGKCEKKVEADFEKFLGTAYPSDKVVDVKNPTCPIGKKAAKDDVTLDWQGHRVHFCCGDCKEKFLKAPNKGLALALYPDLKVADNKKCPITTEDDADADIFVIYKNTLINMCCPDCYEKFKADPEKYVKAAAIELAPQKKDDAKKDAKDKKDGG